MNIYILSKCTDIIMTRGSGGAGIIILTEGFRNSLIYNLPSYWTAWGKLTVWAVLLFSLGRFLMIKNKNGIVGKM